MSLSQTSATNNTQHEVAAPCAPSARRVLHVIDTLEPGGAERSLLEWLSLADRNRYQPLVVTVYRGSTWKPSFEAAGIPVIELGLGGRYQFLRAVVRLSRVARRYRPDVIHTTLFRASQVGRTVGRRLGIPVISSWTGTPYAAARFAGMSLLQRTKLRLLQWMDATTARWVSRFHAVSESVKSANCRALGVAADRVSVVPRGRRPQHFANGELGEAERLRKRALFAAADPLLVCVGRLIPAKGHDVAVAAMPRILREWPDARLVIAGEGPQRDALQHQARKLGVDRAVHLVGHVDDVRPYLQLADLFLFPSLHEGQPGALIEAMMSGCAIVAGDIPAVSEILEHRRTGWLVPPRDSETLAAAVLQLAGDEPTRRRLGTSARNVAQNRFDIARVVEQMANLLDEVLAAHTGGAQRDATRRDGSASASESKTVPTPEAAAVADSRSEATSDSVRAHSVE